MPLSPQEQQEYINRIRKSKTFAKTSTSIALLQYLFEATLSGTDLKEGVIEIEFFKATETPDKNNARVRVNVYNLRKKLLKYYEEEGKDDAYRVSINKGQYEVKFIKQHHAKQGFDKQKSLRLIPYLVMVLVLCSWLISILPPAKPAMWKHFLDKKHTSSLYIGDVYGLYGRTITGGMGWIRDFDINSLQDLYRFRESHPELKDDIRPANYTYATSMAVIASQKLQSLFQRYNSSYTIRFSSKSSISEIKESNALYIGPIKNNTPFLYFFNNENPYLKIDGDLLKLSNHPSINDTCYNLAQSNSEVEYAIVSKLPGPNDTQHFMFMSNHNIGVTSTVEYFTNTDSINAFTDQYLGEKAYFTAIFIAKGKERTNTNLELIQCLVH